LPIPAGALRSESLTAPQIISRTPHWWQWPTVLSLDAPAVALAWQWQLSQVARFSPSWPHVFILGASTWLAYAADRWIEGWRLAPDQIRTQRHQFYQRWRWPIGVIWIAILGADFAVAVLRLDRREFNAGLLLLTPVLAYLLSHQLVHRDRRWRAPKEICVAFLFAGGATIFSFAQPEVPWRPLLAPLILFFSLCFANCALISVWEHEVDRAHGQTSLSLQSRHARQFMHIFPWALALAAGALGSIATKSARPAAWCVAVSAGLLGAVDLAETSLGRQPARVLADFALLTPFVQWLWKLLPPR